jgi:hypothetical protein
MNIERDVERLSELGKGVRSHLGQLRQQGVNEAPLDTIDHQTDEMARIGRRALEELQMLNDSLKASA